MNVIKNQRTIESWDIYFKTHNKFPHPNSAIANRVKKEYTIVEYFPNLEINCRVVVFTTFDNFFIEASRDKPNARIFPMYMYQLLEDSLAGSMQESEEYQLLDNYLSHSPSFPQSGGGCI